MFRGYYLVSPLIAQEIYKLYHTSEVTLVRNVPGYKVVQKGDRLRQFLGVSPEIRIALYQGQLESDRQLDTLIRAARFLDQDIAIVMMGNGPKEILLQLETLIGSEKVASSVKIIPAVPYTQLLDWTASADIGLIIYSPDYSLNVQMCLPNKFFEYLMAGLPVLSSQLLVVAGLIHDYEVGQIVTSLEPAVVGKAISRMLTDQVELDRMHHNALKASQDFCWKKEKEQLICLYQKVSSDKKYL